MYVLTVIHPPANGAAFGKAVTLDPAPMTETFDQVSTFMTEHFGSLGPVNLPGSLAYLLVNTPTGTNVYDAATGCTFRIDPITSAPHPCPCCHRIVLPADLEDVLCAGCYTLDGAAQCLPENTAHTEELR